MLLTPHCHPAMPAHSIFCTNTIRSRSKIGFLLMCEFWNSDPINNMLNVSYEWLSFHCLHCSRFETCSVRTNGAFHSFSNDGAPRAVSMWCWLCSPRHSQSNQAMTYRNKRNHGVPPHSRWRINDRIHHWFHPMKMADFDIPGSLYIFWWCAATRISMNSRDEIACLSNGTIL